jgi:hypothetical protein
VRDQEQEVLGRAEAGTGGLAPAPAAPEPAAPGIDRATRLFEAGDFRSARRLAESALRSESTEVRNAAHDLVLRMRPDPLALWFVVGCAALLIAVVYFTLFR